MALLQYVDYGFLDMVQEAITRYGTPEIFNRDQGCQFTTHEFIGLLQSMKFRFSMDGDGQGRDNGFGERLWWRLIHEKVYLHAYETVHHAQQGHERYVQFYNQRRPHRTLDEHTSDRVYWENLPARHTAA